MTTLSVTIDDTNKFGTILNYTNRLELSILFSKKYVSLQTQLRSR